MSQKTRSRQINWKDLVSKTGQVSDIKYPPVVYRFSKRGFKDSGPKRGVYEQ